MIACRLLGIEKWVPPRMLYHGPLGVLVAEGDEIPEEATADDIRLLVRENRALKVQIRKMQTEMPLLNSLQRRIRILEERLAEK